VYLVLDANNQLTLAIVIRIPKIPTYMTEVDAQATEDNWYGFFRESQQNYPWESKKRAVVWRGALSEADIDRVYTSVRWRAMTRIREINSDKFDAGLTGVPTWVTERLDLDLAPVGGIVTGIHPMTAFQQYVAIMDMDGNSWSSRFSTLLCYNSVVIKVEPQYVEYFNQDLRPWVHYIPVKDDLSDLERNVDWALDPANDEAVRRIIKTANQWCSKTLIPNELARDLLDIMESYAANLDRSDPNWQEVWKQKREEISASSSAFDLIKL
jgi:Glycosyl transferase family 90